MRKTTWAIFIWIAATIGFIILVNTSANNGVRSDCIAEATSQVDRDLCDVGTSLASGVWTVIGVVVGFIGFCVLAVIWFATRSKRHCPACGRDVKKGRTTCKKCGYDLAAALVASGPPAFPPPAVPPPAV